MLFRKTLTGSQELLEAKLDELRDQLRSENPVSMASRSGGKYSFQESNVEKIILKMWGGDIFISFPEIIASCERTGDKLDLASQALICYYLHNTDGALPTDDWISFSDLPHGRFYSRAFQGYTGEEVRRYFQDKLGKFESASKAIGGKPFPLGSIAYTFLLFPYVQLMIVAWLGDEDFPTTYQLLFNSNTHHHLPTDACAIAGSMLVRRLKQAV